MTNALHTGFGLGLAPGAPGLPLGYDPATGLVDPSNVTGQTLPSGVDAGAARAVCTDQGGTFDIYTGLCNTSTVPTLWWVALAALGLFAITERN